jgi:hypothetical protein
MTKQEIIKLYIGDLLNIIPQSPARDNRIALLESELAKEEEPEEKQGIYYDLKKIYSILASISGLLQALNSNLNDESNKPER